MLKCTCPRNIYSPACLIQDHRNTAMHNSGTGHKRRPRGVGKGSYRRRDWKACVENWFTNLFDSGAIGRGILIFVLGFLLLAAGSMVYQRVNDPQTIGQIIAGQVGK